MHTEEEETEKERKLQLQPFTGVSDKGRVGVCAHSRDLSRCLLCCRWAVNTVRELDCEVSENLTSTCPQRPKSWKTTLNFFLYGSCSPARRLLQSVGKYRGRSISTARYLSSSNNTVYLVAAFSFHVPEVLQGKSLPTWILKYLQKCLGIILSFSVHFTFMTLIVKTWKYANMNLKKNHNVL